MDWKTLLPQLGGFVLTFGVPAALYMFRQWSAKKSWGAGASSFAGKAYADLMAMREKEPATPIGSLIMRAVAKQGSDFFDAYSKTAGIIGGTAADAQSRVLGELGTLLAADPSVTVATATSASAATAVADGSKVRLGGYAPTVASPDRGPRVGLPVAVTLALVGLAIGMSGCTAQQQAKVDTALGTQPGQLFCAIQASGGGTVIVGLINAEVAGAAPAAAPAAIIATGASKAYVDEACKRAKGVPVSPPADPAVAPKVAVVPPAAA